jgi:hypothetical protein
MKRLDTQLRLRAIADNKEAMITYLVDASGTGSAAVELIEHELPDAQIFKCFLTGGLRETINYSEKDAKIPKWQLVGNLVSLFDAGAITFPKNARYIDAMLDELQAYALHVNDTGSESFGAKTGAHDDLICAVGLATYWGQHENPTSGPMIW